MDSSSYMRRRDFIRFISVLGASFIIPHSSIEAKEVERLLDNEDREGFYIRFINPIRPIDPKKWTLKVGGLCENPRSFSLRDLQKLDKTTQVSRLKCVESWSSKAKWGGFRPKALFDIVKPKKEAKYLYFYSEDKYYEFIPIEDLLHPRTLFAYEMDDKPLPDVHGGPLRLIVPPKYGYKSVKTILRLEFVEKGEKGYWAKWGYSNEATIQPGLDYALDLKEFRKVDTPGELKY